LLQKDIDEYQQCYGTDVEVSRVNVNGGPGPESSNDGEAALDVEQLIGLAPEVRIVVYQAPNSGADEAAIFAEWVQRNVAKVMSSSWGICEKATGKTHREAIDTLLQEAAAQGQSFFVAAGDYGSTDCYEEPEAGNKESEDEQAKNHFLNVDFPGSDPWATDVGGTRLEDPTAPAPIDYLWNDSENGSWGAGGSGASAGPHAARAKRAERIVDRRTAPRCTTSSRARRTSRQERTARHVPPRKSDAA